MLSQMTQMPFFVPVQSDQQLDCALDLMRRLPPQQIEKNLSDLIDLVRASPFLLFLARYLPPRRTSYAWGFFLLGVQNIGTQPCGAPQFLSAEVNFTWWSLFRTTHVNKARMGFSSGSQATVSAVLQAGTWAQEEGEQTPSWCHCAACQLWPRQHWVSVPSPCIVRAHSEGTSMWKG